MFADLCEVLMIFCFGVSWPISVVKSYRSRTAKGKSIMFEVFIWIGYIFGITRKVILYRAAQAAGTPLDFLFYLGWFFYALNFLEILADMALWVRNTILDKRKESRERKEAEQKQMEIDRLTAENERLGARAAAAPEMPAMPVLPAADESESCVDGAGNGGEA